ncbi:MAG: substrate-binding domain-containing protein [Bauldia sp.]|nr:substrate-binding domain-containing protein [Bauldia sp.]
MQAAEEASDVSGTVYALLPNTTEIWSLWFSPFLEKAFAKYAPNVDLKILNAGGDVGEQGNQMEAAIADGALAVVLAPHDSAQSAGMLEAAANAKVPVVTFVNDPGQGEVTYHVGYLLEQLGAAQPEYLASNFPESPRPFKLAMILGDPKWSVYDAEQAGFDKYLGPLVEDGTIEIVCRYDTIGWVPANAAVNMEQCLTKTGGQVDGVFGNNDDTLTAVWGVIKAQGLEDQIKILNGVDGTLPAIRRVAGGHQLAELLIGVEDMSNAAAQLVVASITGKAAPDGLVNTTFDNKFVEGGVPTVLVPTVVVTPDNIQQTVVDPGFWSVEQICDSPEMDGTDFCSKN